MSETVDLGKIRESLTWLPDEQCRGTAETLLEHAETLATENARLLAQVDEYHEWVEAALLTLDCRDWMLPVGHAEVSAANPQAAPAPAEES